MFVVFSAALQIYSKQVKYIYSAKRERHNKPCLFYQEGQQRLLGGSAKQFLLFSKKILFPVRIEPMTSCDLLSCFTSCANQIR